MGYQVALTNRLDYLESGNQAGDPTLLYFPPRCLEHFHDLYIIPTGIIKYGYFRGSHVGRLHTEGYAYANQSVVFLLYVIHVKLGVGNTRIKKSLLIRFGRFEVIR